MANRKQELSKALTEEARRIAERSQGVVKTEASPSMAFSTGPSVSGIDPTMAAILESWLKANKKK